MLEITFKIELGKFCQEYMKSKPGTTCLSAKLRVCARFSQIILSCFTRNFSHVTHRCTCANEASLQPVLCRSLSPFFTSTREGWVPQNPIGKTPLNYMYNTLSLNEEDSYNSLWSQRISTNLRKETKFIWTLSLKAAAIDLGIQRLVKGSVNGKQSNSCNW